MSLLPTRSGRRTVLYSQCNRHNITQIQCHCCQRENRIRRHRARKVQEPRQNTEERRKPDRTDRRLCPRVDFAEEASVWESVVAGEGVDGSGAGLQCCLDDEEGGEADPDPEEEGAASTHAKIHDLAE